jgi:hypothetical protein
LIEALPLVATLITVKLVLVKSNKIGKLCQAINLNCERDEFSQGVHVILDFRKKLIEL